MIVINYSTLVWCNSVRKGRNILGESMVNTLCMHIMQLCLPNFGVFEYKK
jgi:hypothetical protein